MKTKVSRTVAGFGVHPSIHHAALVIDRVWWMLFQRHPIVTGLGEEGHSEGSRHYGYRVQTAAGKLYSEVRCMAIDIRDDLSEVERERADAELRQRLGEGEYDLVWETKGDGTPSHLHVEVDPKP